MLENQQLTNWRTQVKKGYLELCILLRILHKKRIYGFELLEDLKSNNLSVKEGTLYPLINRMTEDKILSSTWETENVKGHPRKFYSLTPHGLSVLSQMQTEFEQMYTTYFDFKTYEEEK